jgi:tight adherence protein B
MLIVALMLAGVFLGAAWFLYRHAETRKADLEGLERRIALQGGTVAAVVRHVRPFAVPARMEPVLARAQIEPTPRLLAMLVVGAGLAFCVTLVWLGVLEALGTVLLGAAVLVIYVRERARRRTEAFIEALPFFLDNIRQLLAVGNSLSQALLRGVASAPGPIQAYLGTAARRLELGAPVGDAVQQSADRLAIPEVAMLAAAVRTNLRFGGAMTGVIANLVYLIRERLRIRRELASATAEVRVSTRLLVAMPLALTAFLFATIPPYRAFFFHDPRGHHLAAAALVMQGLGMAMMVRLQRLAF